MSVKAALKIVLMANETMVAECEDPSLWQKVLAAIGSSKQDEIDQPLDEPIRGAKDLPPKTSKTDSKEKFAKELDVSLAVVEAACSPSEKSPFIHLDKHNWEALEKNLPARGPRAVADIVVATTILLLWKNTAGLGNSITLQEAKTVLDTIGASTKNPGRAMGNCEWVQKRGESFQLNPALISKAVKIVRAYCLKENPYQTEEGKA
jgi:hypothetical protein